MVRVSCSRLSPARTIANRVMYLTQPEALPTAPAALGQIDEWTVAPPQRGEPVEQLPHGPVVETGADLGCKAQLAFLAGLRGLQPSP